VWNACLRTSRGVGCLRHAGALACGAASLCCVRVYARVLVLSSNLSIHPYIDIDIYIKIYNALCIDLTMTSSAHALRLRYVLRYTVYTIRYDDDQPRHTRALCYALCYQKRDKHKHAAAIAVDSDSARGSRGHH